MRKAIVTGAYGAIGKAIAQGVAKAGYDVTLVGRDEAALEACRGELAEQTGNRRISHAAVDLSDKDQIRAFAGTWDGSLHLLINNAVTAPRRRTETPLYCALDPDLKGVTGKYFAHRREESCGFSSNRNEVEQLYAACAKY